MTAIEEMAGMDVLCSDKTGTLTLNKLSVDKNLIEVGCQGFAASCFFYAFCKFSVCSDFFPLNCLLRSLTNEWMQILLF